MIVLGIDPGTHRIGWGVISKSHNHYTVLAHGCLEFAVHSGPSLYLPKIREHLFKVCRDYRPDSLALETLLFQKNVKTALAVAEARGVIRLTAAEAKVEVRELAPNTVKLAVTGYGASDKRAVARMVGLLLSVSTQGLRDDEVDALAIAYASLS